MTTRCATHPDVETGLSCASCGTPICPRCMVETPVGMKCRRCARLTALPVFQVSASLYLRAVAAGVVLAAALGFGWGLIRALTPFSGWFSLIISLGAGYAIGELMYLSARRWRGTWLAAIGAASAVLCYAIALFIPALLFNFSLSGSIFDLVFAAAAGYMAVTRLR